MSATGKEETHAYVGFRPCGHAMFIAVDDGGKDLGREIAKLIGSGHTIERKTIEEARVTPIVYCSCVRYEIARGRKPSKSDRRQVERRADKRRLDDKRKARIKR